MSGNALKHSYTIPCSSAFRDAVIELAGRANVNVADLARSVVLMMPAETIAAFPDPGEPGMKDRETVILKSGSAKGRPWRRKPRLQVRMAPQCDIVTIRRALGLALAMDRGEKAVRLEGPDEAVAAPETEKAETDLIRETREEIERLRAMISVLSFEPLPDGVTSREDALHILGFAPGSMPDHGALKARFRTLAIVHHPDGAFGSHHRMSQLNAAMERLRRNAA
ncbi:MAG: molecular chaperone DnaJ [Rhodospirillales bacterium RIFCSPLOWO2_12_FULL_58_28]|nr:MAG: molecular chaperone DnaJ [Rhodospirillales bacterium RIFCSPLOWO2_02_FULL_58_16]OHC79917.1 MAG: molecular chaperone DnaJ [Rhodospirillales bacterium RIFCSPLOWO2_12_FULL_58_28]